VSADLDPYWTRPLPSGRVRNPTGAVTVRDRSFARLMYPVLSNAITHRLRYLSFWCWVIDNTEDLSKEERAQFEKIFLYATKAHDCANHQGLGERGLVGAERSVEKLPSNHPSYGNEDVTVGGFYTTDIDPLPLSAEFTQLTKSNGSGFDNYYKNWAKRLFFLRNKSTVTPMGEQLAETYANAHEVRWERVHSAVSEEAVPHELLRDLAGSGCLCSPSDKEQQLYRLSWFGLLNDATSYSDLSYSSAPHEDLQDVSIERFLKSAKPSNDETKHLSDEFLEAQIDREAETNLERFTRYGHNVNMRASQLLFLHSAHVTPLDATVCSGSDHPLEEVRRLWRLHLQSEQFAWVLESLLGLFLEMLANLGPSTVTEIIEGMIQSDPFNSAVCDALGGLENHPTEDSPNRFDEVQLGILYGKNTDVQQEVRSTSATAELPQSWSGLIADISNHGSEGDPFDRNRLSEWQLRRMVEYHRGNTAQPSDQRIPQAVGYAAVLLGRLQSRYDQYYQREDLRPYCAWYAETVQHSTEPPNLQMIWDPTQYFGLKQTQSIREVVAGLLRNCLVRPYLDRLYSRMESGKIPQHFTVDGTGKLRFERRYGNATLSRLKWRRNWDTLYELNLVTSHSPREFEVTKEAKQILKQVLGESMP